MTITKNERGIFWATAADISSDQTSNPLDMKGAKMVALQAIVSGTATLVGPIYVQGSMDYSAAPTAPTWVTLEDSAGAPITAATLASGAGPYSDGGVTEICWPWIRFFFDRTSGTGTINAYVTVCE